MSKDLNNIFYINKLRLINTDPLLSQPINNTQFPPIQENKKKKFVVEDIMAECYEHSQHINHMLLAIKPAMADVSSGNSFD